MRLETPIDQAQKVIDWEHSHSECPHRYYEKSRPYSMYTTNQLGDDVFCPSRDGQQECYTHVAKCRLDSVKRCCYKQCPFK